MSRPAPTFDADLDWTLDAPCATDLDLMFDRSRQAEALKVCDGCGFKVACRELYDEVARSAWGNAVHGIWFGTTEEQRRRRRTYRSSQQVERDRAAELRAAVHTPRPRDPNRFQVVR